jgi:hypothetical protein
MEQQPDKLFRERLEGFGKPVPPSAWTRVEAELNKKKNRTFWLKVAASLSVLAVATVLLWPAHTSENNLAARKNSSEKNQGAKENKKAFSQQSATPQQEQSQQPVSPEKTIPASVSLRESRKLPVRQIPEEVSVQEAVNMEAAQEKIAAVEESVTTPSEISGTTQSTEKEGGVTLVYTVEEVNAKYLDKKSLAEATSEEKKPSTLKKLLDKAYDLKNNHDPVGDLRQKKNEIFALNFKSEKQRSQNK